MHKFKVYKLFNKIVLTSMLVFGSLNLTTPIISHAADISKPSSWPKWTQLDMSQPWNKAWGQGNGGCYMVSMSVQAARSGLTSIGGKDLNPLTISQSVAGGGVCGGEPIHAKGGGKSYTFQQKKTVGNYSGNINSAPAMGASKVKSGYKSLTKAGLFPIVHIDAASGYKEDDTHYMAVRKLSGNTMSVYDPARNSGYSTVKNGIGGKNLLDVTAWLEGWGSGPKDFNHAPAPAAGSTDSTGSKGSKSNKSSGKDGAPKIKPIFNPFTTPTVTNPDIGADTASKNSAIDRGTQLTFYQWLGPKFVQWVQIAAIICMMGFIGWAMVIALISLADNQMAGLLSNSLESHQGIKNILFPDAGTKAIGITSKTMINLCIIVFICGLVLTDTLPLILGQIFYWLSLINF